MHHRAALDSDALTFFVEAMRTGYRDGGPSAAVAQEGTAVLRSYLYARHVFTLLPTAVTQYRRIRDTAKLAFFEEVAAVILLDAVPRPGALEVETKWASFSAFHSGSDDCRLLAEADVMGIPYLLTFDRKFRRALACKADCTRVVTPSEYWNLLGVPSGAQPRISPDPSNPLARETWWRW
jgi:hypothetical protein